MDRVVFTLTIGETRMRRRSLLPRVAHARIKLSTRSPVPGSLTVNRPERPARARFTKAGASGHATFGFMEHGGLRLRENRDCSDFFHS